MTAPVTDSSILLEAHDLKKSYGPHVAVDGLSLCLPRGTTLGLLGPNGAGKSTTLHMLVGLLRPDSGSLHIDGRTDAEASAVRRLIGIAPQSLSLYEELTAEENLNFFGRLYGLAGSGLNDRIDWALEFARLTDRRRHRVSTYSGGMKRRLNFACALLHEPHLVLLDEPTVGVDPQSRNHIFEGIERLQADGLTIIYTTHYMEEAQRLCDRVAIMDHGRILDVGTLPELLERHGGDSVITGESAASPPPGFPGTWDGQIWRYETANPYEALQTLPWGDASFSRLQIDQPDLESIFLKLTGRSLRD